MNYVLLQTYNNYIEAHLAQGILNSENINCWLKDENTVTIDPLLTNAVGGIKLMVAADQTQQALKFLMLTHNSFRNAHPCPNCGSTDIDYVSTPRKASNWIVNFIGLILNGGAPMQVEKVYHCFNCGHEYEINEDNTKPSKKVH